MVDSRIRIHDFLLTIAHDVPNSAVFKLSRRRIRSQEMHESKSSENVISLRRITQFKAASSKQYGRARREALSNLRNIALFLVAAYDAFSHERHDSAAQLVAELDATNETHKSEF